MARQIVECIPNFSEARRPEIVQAIAASVSSIQGVQILDQHSDLDHNRTVITFVGPKEAVEAAAYQSIETAARLIDLNQHTGEHPRIGAADVVPFVPISGVTMEECIEMAHRLAKRVASQLNIPVYLYEEAAQNPDRKNLENIRKGQYEGLKEEILTNPNRKPDYGPAELGPAGATVIGARNPLIAFNVYLTSDDVEIAQKIARTIRFSTGGLRFVKAMGVLVDGRAQVSMNLTHFRKTPLAQVVEMIRREAQRYGVAIHHSELVGLIPQEALEDAAVWYLQLDQFEKNQILENRLADLAIESASVAAPEPSFIDELASASPTPGGGSASAYAGAMAAALVCMVARVTLGKKKYAEVEAEMLQTIETASALQAHLQECVAQDSAAFEAFIHARRLPKDTPEQEAIRLQAISVATYQAASVPLDVAENSLKVLKLAQAVARKGNLNAVSDAASAAALAQAAIIGAGHNVRINLIGLESEEQAAGMLQRLQEIETAQIEIHSTIHTIIKERSQ